MARLIDSGPDVIVLVPEVEGVDSDGNPVRSALGAPVTVTAQLHRMGETESAALGLPATTVFFNTSMPLPVGSYAKATVRGRTWDVVGEPIHMGRSERTSHTRVVLAQRQAKPVNTVG